MWDSGDVKSRWTIRNLVAALAWLGLVFAPLTAPVATSAVSMEMTAAEAESDLTAMPEGMPCCPDRPAKPDCPKDCPLTAVCATTVVLTLVSSATLYVPIALLAVIVPHDDAKLSGLAQGPPVRPPKA